jgi:hydrophobe/amphiphile efflux-3 (HAE3) family protein
MILDKIAEGCEKRPRMVIAAVLVVTIVLGLGILRIEKETDIMTFLPEEKESVEVTLEFVEDFGGQEYEYILVKGDVISPDGIQEIVTLEHEIRAIPGFALSVESYVGFLKMQGVPDEMLPMAIQTPETRQLLSGLVTGEGKAALIQVRVDPQYTGDIQEYIDILHKERTLNVSYTGRLTQAEDMLGTIDRDNILLLPLAGALVVFVLYASYRKFSDVVLPFLVISVSVVWVLGIIGYVGIKFSSMFVAIAPLIFGVAVAYSVHMLTRYYEERVKGKDSAQAAVTSIKTVGMAIFLTAITTAFGFGSFSVSELPPLQNFGLILILGIAFNFILVVTLMPSLLVLRDRKKPEEKKRVSRVNKALDKAALFALRRRNAVLLITGVTVVICALIAPTIPTTISYDDMLPEEAVTISTQEEISALFGGGGSEAMVIMVEGDVLGKYQEVLQLENEIRAIDLRNEDGAVIVGQVISYADVLYMAQGNIEGALKDPQAAAILSQTLILNPENPDYLKKGLVLVMVNAQNDADAKEITKEVRDIVKDSSLTMRVGGAPALMADILEGMQSTQIKTTVLALILSLIVVSLLFRSIPLGVFTVIPVVLTIAWEFGVLKLAGWNLDLFTIMVSALIIGIGIDFSIHVVHRCREEFAQTKDAEKSLENTVLQVGKALTSATATTAGAFMVLAFSSMPIMTRFGSFVAIVIVLSFLAALFVLPSILISYFKRKS